MSVTVGKKVKNAKLKTTKGNFDLKSLLGQNVVIYFYPKDATPGCTTEGRDFQAAIKAFEKLNCTVLGVSKDPMKSHEKFCEKEGFEFPLVSDEDGTLCELFDVFKEKSMYGKTYMGIERSTFLIDETGTLVCEWRKVKVPGHVKEVLKALQASS